MYTESERYHMHYYAQTSRRPKHSKEVGQKVV